MDVEVHEPSQDSVSALQCRDVVLERCEIECRLLKQTHKRGSALDPKMAAAEPPKGPGLPLRRRC